MPDQSGVKPHGPPGRFSASLSTDEVRAFTDRAPRCKVRLAVQCQQPGAREIVETQLVNVSRSGMFLSTPQLLEIGTTVEFQFSLDDDVVVLKGSAEVVRLTGSGESGMGLRFADLDAAGRELIDRIVEVGSREPPPGAPEPAAALPAGGRPVEYDHGRVRVVLSPATAVYFTYNPLLHIGVGGCFIPADDDVPLGTGYQLDVVDAEGRLVLRCKAKVAAQQEGRIGLRLIDVDRAALRELRAEIARLAPT